MADWAYALSQGLAAGANTGADIVGTQMKIVQQTDAEQVAANIKLDTATRMQAIQEAMQARATEKFMASKQGIIDQKVGQKYAGSDAAAADADAGNTDAPLTDDQKAAIAQSKQQYSGMLDSDSNVNINAGLASGTISPVEATQMSNKNEYQQSMLDQRDNAAQLRYKAMEDRLTNLQAMTTQTNETRAQIAALKESMGKNNKVDTATGRMMITSLDADQRISASQLKVLQDQIQYTRKPDERKALQDKIDGLNDDLASIRKTKQSFFDSMGVTSTQGAAKDDPSASIGVRQNNPGNIKKTDGSGDFETYPTPAAGFEAIKGQLLRYAKGQTTGKPVDTVSDIINTWAPPTDGNDTDTYIKQVAADLGVDPDKPLNLTTSPNTMQKLAAAISRREVGPKAAESFINPGAKTRPAAPVMAGKDPLGLFK